MILPERSHDVSELIAPQLYPKVLVLSSDCSGIEAVQSALPVAQQLICTIHHGELNSILQKGHDFRLVFIDEGSGILSTELMNIIQANWPGAAIILFSNDLHSWVEFIQNGAYDVLPKPVNVSDLSWISAGALLKQKSDGRNAITGH